MAEKIRQVESDNSKSLVTTKAIDHDNTNLASNEDIESYQLAAIFPPEVWQIILVEKVGASAKAGAERLINCTLASPYFRSLLANERNFFLFPHVFETLTIWLQDAESKNETNPDQEETEQHVSSLMFKLSDIIICREVCSAWNKVFGEFYQNPDRYSQMQHNQNKLPCNLCEAKIYYESGEREEDVVANLNPYQDPSIFLDHFAKTHGGSSNKLNPFPGRSIKFRDIEFGNTELLEPRHQVFCQGISRVIEMYGDNLWHCDMQLEDVHLENHIEFYLKFKERLSQMPNLKTFQINCSHIFEAEDIYSTDEIFNRMSVHISRNPLPILKNLQFLKVQNLAPVIFSELIRNSGQNITQLEIKRAEYGYNKRDYDIYSSPNLLVGLKELSVKFGSVKHFERMENSVAAQNWKLEKFYFLYEFEEEFLAWARILHMISNNWSGSVTNLVLQMPVAKTDTDKDFCLETSLSSTVLQLPLLKRVKLIVKNPLSLDFLLASGNLLDCMEIIADYNIDVEKGRPYYKMVKARQIVNFLGFENSMDLTQSKILENFPKLKVLKIVTLLNRKNYIKGKYWYRFYEYNEGSIKSEDRLEYQANLF